ncbi:hypothetical protein KY290_005390 [Solanum tuberosum]|uniref:Uncharacterized protein n=1 Tax=Solanum tuberosum TaxID=4113 RepID=A0ABQ7WFW2_SOLTU|nr:hypothetical protein KY289_005786 [Solanum tuberosum]KAH0778963.1 hypothetical protein KY290_005390 [Solanum tuberosum]
MLIRPPSPLSTYASGNPFTPSPSPPHSETPIPPHSISPPPSLVESPIPTITTTPPLPPPTNPNDPNLDDIPLNQLHPKIPWRPHKHIAIKRTHICVSFPRSASQAQLQEGVESSKKRKRTGKSLVPRCVSPVLLDSESSPAAPSSQDTKMNKNLAKYLTLGKDKYFSTKKGWEELFLDTRLHVHEKEVREFYTNLNVLEGSVATSSVNGVDFVIDSVRLDEIFHIPSVGLSNYVWTKDVNSMLT